MRPSELAIAEIERMRMDGLNPSVAQIIRINDAGRAVERVRGDASPFAAPRSVVCGGQLFHEPTIASTLWLLAMESDVVAFAGGYPYADLLICAYALHNARVPGFFDRPESSDVPGIWDAVLAFRRSVSATADRLSRAVEWLYRGDPEEEDEKKAEEQDDHGSDPDPDGYADLLYSSLAEAVSVGLSGEELRLMTSASLRVVIERNYRYRNHRWEGMDTEELGKFYDLVDKVRRQLSGSKD